MKQLTIDLNNKEKLILVELPIGASNMRNVKLESGKEAIVLGTYTPQKGINFNDLVKREWVEPRSRLTDTYTDYTQEMSVGFQDYEDSFISLLKTETGKAFPLKENPYPKRPKIIGGQYAVMENESLTEAIDNTNKFNESESKVMPHKFVVFLVNNAI